jgi:periplasmic copper chaperone A
MKRWMTFLFLAVLFLSACSPQPAARAGSIEVVSPWVRPAEAMGADMGGANGAAYMTLRNTGSAADRLIKVETTVAETGEMHETKMDGDVMSMAMVDAIEVPANGSVELKPGGYHIMLINLKEDLKVGATVKLTLTFEKAGMLQVEAVVKQP